MNTFITLTAANFQNNYSRTTIEHSRHKPHQRSSPSQVLHQEFLRHSVNITPGSRNLRKTVYKQAMTIFEDPRNSMIEQWA